MILGARLTQLRFFNGYIHPITLNMKTIYCAIKVYFWRSSLDVKTTYMKFNWTIRDIGLC